jgi:hypothetical protein
MCFGCVASSTYWDAASEDHELESPEELRRKKLELLRERLDGSPVRVDEEVQAFVKSTVASSHE